MARGDVSKGDGRPERDAAAGIIAAHDGGGGGGGGSSISAFSFPSSINGGIYAARSPTFSCTTCGAPHGNLYGNGECVDCNSKNGKDPTKDVEPNGK